MLQAMQQPAAQASSPTSPTFAGLLAALASSSSAAPDRQPAWSDDRLADDVATLSYERALRAHSRYKALDLSDRTLTQPADAAPNPVPQALPADCAAPQAAVESLPSAIAEPEPDAAPEPAAAQDRNLKCASITIRLSKAECAQLRLRAAEAGLTVSAYLRSCTFEAEALRAMVKDTLAQLRADAGKESRTASTPAGHGWRTWLARLRPHPRPGEPINLGSSAQIAVLKGHHFSRAANAKD